MKFKLKLRKIKKLKLKLRKKYGIEPGQEVIAFKAGDHIEIIPISKNPLKTLSGKYSWDETAEELKKMAEDQALKEVELRDKSKRKLL